MGMDDQKPQDDGDDAALHASTGGPEPPGGEHRGLGRLQKAALWATIVMMFLTAILVWFGYRALDEARDPTAPESPAAIEDIGGDTVQAVHV